MANTDTTYNLKEALAKLHHKQQRQQQDQSPKSYEMSSGQERIWATEQIKQDMAVYNMPVGYRLRGHLDLDALQAAFRRLIARHDCLRSSFQPSRDRTYPLVTINDNVQPEFHVIDLSDQEMSQREAELTRLGLEEVRTPFDLTKPKLLRIKVFRLSSREHVLLINIHHIISDGWSHGIMIRDLNIFYQAEVNGSTNVKLPSTTSYSLHIDQQRTYQNSEQARQDLEYWKNQLADTPPLITLPYDRTRPAEQTQNGDVFHFEIEEETLTQLKAVARQFRTSVYTVIMAGVKVLLYRQSGEQDFAIGSPVAARFDRRFHNTMGYFSNTIAIRSQIDGNATFADYLAQVKETIQAALRHQGTAFDRVVDAIQPDRTMAYHPIFQLMFTYQNQPLEMPKFGDCEAAWNLFHSATAKFDLWLSLEERQNRLEGHFEYSTDLFDKATMIRLSENLKQVLKHLQSGLQEPVDRLPVVSQQDIAALRGFNETSKDYTLETLVQSFERQVEATPKRTALVFEESKLTYEQFNHQSNQVARLLRHHGITKEDFVAVVLERSFAMMRAIYATQKAGGAYIPVDPSYPADRVQFMLEDSRAKIVITSKTLAIDPQNIPGKILYVEDIMEQAQEFAGDNLPDQPGLDNAAYMIYTSGSTGTPKGAIIPHRAISNRLKWKQDYFQLNSSDTVFQKTPFSFDVSVWELFWPLQVGAKLIIAKPDGHKDPAYMIAKINQHAITTMHFVPSMLRVFLDDSGIAQCRSLERVICSGEELAVDLVREFTKQSTNGKVYNLYGPTEAAVDVTAWTCSEQDLSHGKIPIGKPISNISIHILDRLLQPVAIGVPGELCIAGIGVGRGYHRRPELTAEKFCTDPNTGARIYRTGDKAKYNSNGSIEFLGRFDHQIKINGLRVEVGEIESKIAAHEDVNEAIVMTKTTQSGATKLVAYCVPTLGGDDRSLDRSLYSGAAGAGVEHWEVAFDSGYDEQTPEELRKQNFITWNNSYDGAAIPEEEMRQWWQETVDLIRAEKPSKVLEIGCGTGLFLYELAPECRVYHGTDISNVVLKQLKAGMQSEPETYGHVKLEKRAAHDFEGLSERAFDTIIINSVAQYFPSATYLLDVIDHALQCLEDGGKIILGDVRNFDHLLSLQAGIALSKAEDDTVISDLKNTAIERTHAERELLMAPALFEELAKSHGSVAETKVCLKRGPYLNELSKFRYDVVITKGSPIKLADADAQNFEFDRGRNLVHLEQTLHDLRPGTRVTLHNVPNSRLTQEKYLVETFFQQDLQSQTSSAMQQALKSLGSNHGLDPNWAYQLAASKNLQVVVTPSASNPKWMFDAIFTSARSERKIAPTQRHHWLGSMKDLLKYANNPQFENRAKEVEVIVKGYLQDNLPEYMVPSKFVFLPRFMLSANGKVDRKELPDPFARDQESDAVAYEPPEGWVEETISSIWAEVLSVDTVGRNANFFDQGGDSIKAIQLVWRCSKLGINFETKDVFNHQTLRALGGMAQIGDVTQETEVKEALNFDASAYMCDTYTDIEKVYPLAPFQRWNYKTLQQDDAIAGQATVWMILPLEGKLNRSLFLDTWNELLERYPIMRSGFVKDEDGRIKLATFRSIDLPLVEISTESLDEQAQIQAVYDRANKLRAEGFDLFQAPQFKMTLFKQSDESYRLLYFWNYMLHDGWSFSMILKDFVDIYKAKLLGKTIELKAPAPYEPYGQSLVEYQPQASEDFWRHQLKGYPDNGFLSPYFQDADMGEGYSKAVHPYSTKFTAAVQQFCRDQRTTISTLFHAMWALLVAEITQQDDVIFGTMVSGRRPEVEGAEYILGQLCNVIPFRITVPVEDKFLNWTEAVRNQVFAIQEHELTPLDAIQDIAQGRIFDNYLVIINTPHPKKENDPDERMLAETRQLVVPAMSDFSQVLSHVQVPWRFDICPIENVLWTTISFRHDVFAMNRVQSALGIMANLVQQLVDNPSISNQQLKQTAAIQMNWLRRKHD